MKRLFIVICLLSAFCRADAQYVRGGGYGPPPPPAVTAGYGALTFNSTFVPSSVDVSGTYISGFSWYIGNFFGVPPSNPVSFNGDGTATINGSPGNAGLQLATAALKVNNTPASGWVGTAFGGGAYFEATFKFDPTQVVFANTWPAFWSMSIEHLAALPSQQWVGQVAGYSHFSEVDFFEYDIMQQSWAQPYGGASRDWYGVQDVTCTPPPADYCTVDGPANVMRVVPAGTNYNIYHTYGLLWIPATGSTSGTLTWYFDNVAIGSAITYSQFTNQTPPPVATWNFGVVDQEHLVMIFGTGATSPMTVVSARVWQASPAGNLVQ